MLPEGQAGAGEALAKQAKQELDTLDPLVSRAVGLVSRWSGVVRVEPNLDALGIMRWDGSISLSVRAMESADRARTQIHELLHAHSPGLTRLAFDGNRGWEEGVVEQLQRLLRGPLLAEAGQENPAVYGDAVDRAHLYNIYIAALETVRQATGDDPLGFYTGLLAQPVEARSVYLVNRIHGLTGDGRAGRVKPLQAWSAAGAVLRRDLNRESQANHARLLPEIDASADFLFAR